MMSEPTTKRKWLFNPRTGKFEPFWPGVDLVDQEIHAIADGQIARHRLPNGEVDPRVAAEAMAARLTFQQVKSIGVAFIGRLLQKADERGGTLIAPFPPGRGRITITPDKVRIDDFGGDDDEP